jgi:hypothetical protein
MRLLARLPQLHLSLNLTSEERDEGRRELELLFGSETHADDKVEHDEVDAADQGRGEADGEEEDALDEAEAMEPVVDGIDCDGADVQETRAALAAADAAASAAEAAALSAAEVDVIQHTSAAAEAAWQSLQADPAFQSAVGVAVTAAVSAGLTNTGLVQALGTDGWLAQATLVAPTSGPQGRRGRASRDDAAPAAETAPTGQGIAATDDAAPAPVAEGQLPDPPAEIVVRPEVLDEATDTAAPSQAEQVTHTAQAEQAEES